MFFDGLTPKTVCPGPLNYNPVEEFFFHRIKAGRPICVPGSGMQVCVRARACACQARPGHVPDWGFCSQHSTALRAFACTPGPASNIHWIKLFSFLELYMNPLLPSCPYHLPRAPGR